MVCDELAFEGDACARVADAGVFLFFLCDLFLHLLDLAALMPFETDKRRRRNGRFRFRDTRGCRRRRF